ncbi:DNA-protecting protein DprA [Hyphomicrobiales bacterium]|nr:DNA-protecting protein DprA [Hyphomicrobiales bacterium]CAH1701997.1 DNA-protecting protein DprA [Hyphomicrobiales bacterium]CAI0346155.1 DNA processing protein [Hyphomicrobiales bacterium]
MAGIVLSDRQRLDWLRLIRSESIGPRSFRSLMNRFGGAAAALEALPELARQAGRSIRICPAAEAEREIEGLRRLGARLIALGEAEYPIPLQAIDSAPPLIAVRGRVEVLQKPAVALVGSRNASAAGLKFTGRLARELGEADFIVVSGLARGIDTAAHQASLETGTVAVLAGGLDEIYPPQNLPLAESIVERGAIVSEMPLGWVARARDFPRRNRLVSGLSLGTVVVEAARRSGSLITARFANEQGRLVFAVPGSPLDPRAEGGNHLIREGATLCADASHVIEALAPLRRQEPGAWLEWSALREASGQPVSEAMWDELELPEVLPAPGFARHNDDELQLPAESAQAPAGLSPLRRVVLELLGPTPVGLDDLVRASGHGARDVNRMLVELELEGEVRRHPGGALSRLRA